MDPQTAAMAAQQPGIIAQIIPFILIAAIFYFLLIRPQNKQMKETQKMLSELKSGDKVLTRGGIVGVIKDVRETEIDLEISKGVKVIFARTAVQQVIQKR
ncbi:MAG: preprotein translocase subunit YajC [Elusimicrobiales bacterium]|nr:preprotein translocase subunit YajC [Elusimicrobiales bacterium]